MHYTATFRKRLSPQGRILRHVVGHLPVPSLDVPVPQMVDQLPDIEHFFAALSPDPEQVIEVPKILPLDVPMRAALRVTQLVETAGGSTDDRVLLFFTADCGTARLVVEDQVLVFMFFSQDSVQHRRLPESAFLSGLWSRSLTLFLVEVFLVHLPGQTSSASSSSPAGDEERADEPDKGVFRTFPPN